MNSAAHEKPLNRASTIAPVVFISSCGIFHLALCLERHTARGGGGGLKPRLLPRGARCTRAFSGAHAMLLELY